NNDPITSDIKVENTDSAPATITASISGSMALTGPSVPNLVTPLSTQKSFTATAFDGTIDFSGTSGHDFGAQSATGSNSVTLTSATDMAPYIGTSTVSFTEATNASATATGSANLIVNVQTTASANVTVIYTYIPSNSLKPGDYIIVEPQQPNGYLDGF